MKKLLIGLLLSICGSAEAYPILGTVQISTSTTITPVLQTGAFNTSSGTVQNLTATTAGVKYLTVQSTGSFVGLTLSTITVSSATLTGVTGSTITFSSATFTSANIAGGTFAGTVSGAVSNSSVATSTLTVTSSMTALGNVSFSNTAATFTMATALSTSTVTSAVGVTGQAFISQGAGKAPAWTYPSFNAQLFTATASSATTASTFIRTNHKVTITPKSASDNILLMVSCTIANSSIGTGEAEYTIERNASNLAGAQGFGECAANAASTVNLTCPVSIVFIDSPASTSALVYEVYIRSTSGVTTTWNINNGTCTMYALEIGAS